LNALSAWVVFELSGQQSADEKEKCCMAAVELLSNSTDLSLLSEKHFANFHETPLHTKIWVVLREYSTTIIRVHHDSDNQHHNHPRTPSLVHEKSFDFLPGD
jgi:hypothetical protein